MRPEHTMQLPEVVKHGEWQTGMTLWFTGLSGAGKTTLCRAVGDYLSSQGFPVAILDGDEIRQTISAGLGYSREDREENIRRITMAAEGLVESGVVTLVAVISPYATMRTEARKRLGRFIEIYVNASLPTCIERDPKGLYHRALIGEIPDFTAINDPYEPPLNPEVECNTDSESIEQSVAKILNTVFAKGLRPPPWGAIRVA
jgi:adenylylsulfate kinase